MNHSSKSKKYGLHIEASTASGVAKIQLTDKISQYGGTSANAVRTLIKEFTNKGVTKAELYINSQGGSVFEAAEIANELKTKFKEVSITVGAVAASAATRILVEFDNVKAFANSQLMIHRPKMSTYGDLNQIESDKKMLLNATNDYRAAYAKRFNKTEDEIDELWANGDYWMNAQEAKDLGLISEIIQENQEIEAEDVAVLEACGCPTVPKIEKQTINRMDINKMRSALGLDATATEEEVLAAAKTAREKAEKANELEAEALKNAKAKAEALVDKAISDKKVKAEKRDSMIALATADYNNASEIIESMQVVPKLSGKLKAGETDKEKENWDLEAWLEKDPEGLEAMAETDPEKFKKINNID